MKLENLHNFISPITGRILADPNYVLVGNSKGIATPSPILIDIRLDILNITRGTNIVNNASFVIGQPNSLLPNAQVLSSLSNGFLFNTSGILSSYNIIPLNNLPDLRSGYVFIGDNNNRARVGLPPEGPRGPEGPKGYSGDDVVGINGIEGLLGAIGAAGVEGKKGRSGKTGAKGAAGDNAINTLDILTNYNMSGNDIMNISQSPGADFDAVTAKWLWNLVSDNTTVNF